MNNGGVRVGTVTDAKLSERIVRVHFEDVDIVSGWLRVIKSPPFIPYKNVPQKTEEEQGGSGYAEFAAHKHDVIISPWFPDIGEKVLCLYDSGFNADGYVLGAI